VSPLAVLSFINNFNIGIPADVRAGLAIKSHAPKAPTWALLAGVFLRDFFWIAFGLAGIEPSQGPTFFDEWVA
jgi:hypothetical protein